MARKGSPEKLLWETRGREPLNPWLVMTLAREAQEARFPLALNSWRYGNRDALQKQGSVMHPLEADDGWSLWGGYHLPTEQQVFPGFSPLSVFILNPNSSCLPYCKTQNFFLKLYTADLRCHTYCTSILETRLLPHVGGRMPSLNFIMSWPGKQDARAIAHLQTEVTGKEMLT